ncbi:hypothetical protein [Microbacterium album]|uniref:Uncharacterized protein n=1 Tax=Microbacterium album TaxID=2053191 RepID=A0A917MLI1_9MICO|nr:hypothetical protein [Microbacterium album]GGH42561.1 hypothetical protein GCM10010921_15860 [Microbacterium album]
MRQDPSNTNAEGVDNSAPTTAEAAKEAAAEVAGAAREKAKAASEQAESATDEAKDRIQDAGATADGELKDRLETGQGRVAGGLRTAGEKLGAMAPEDGVARDLADKASAGLNQASSWVSGKDASAMVDEAKSFVRRKPWVAAAGAVAGLFLLSRIARRKR